MNYMDENIFWGIVDDHIEDEIVDDTAEYLATQQPLGIVDYGFDDYQEDEPIEKICIDNGYDDPF